MSVSSQIAITATTTEVIGGNPDSASAGNRTVTHALFNVSKSLDADSDPAITKQASFKLALAAGAAVIDLTDLLGTNGVSVDGTGLVVRYARVTNLGLNPMTVSEGASNGHDFWAESPVTAGGTVAAYAPGETAEIDATHKTWDVAGTGTDQCQVTILLGPPAA